MNLSRDTFHNHYNQDDKPKKSEIDLDTEMRGRMVSGDPMMQYFKEKERQKSGTQEKPVYKSHYPPNRYNIRPGHRWDGVDRSNGYEKRLLDKEAAKKAGEEQNYRNLTRDM